MGVPGYVSFVPRWNAGEGGGGVWMEGTTTSKGPANRTSLINDGRPATPRAPSGCANAKRTGKGDS